jgi:hypothetical protein
MCGNLFEIEEAETHLERTTGEGDFNFCAFQRRKPPKDRPRRIESGGKSKSSGKRKKLGITTHDQE